MPKKLKFEKTYQDAVCKIYKNTYRVISFWDNDNKKQWLKYYQVQKNRKKIHNFQNLDTAIRRMLAEANYELQDMFTYSTYEPPKYVEENTKYLQSIK